MNIKRALTEDEIIEIIERELPRIIESKPEVRYKIEEILDRKAATKEDIKILLQEIEKNRIEADKRFEAMDKRFEAIGEEIKILAQQIEKNRIEADKKFEQGIKRIERIISAIGSRWGYGAEKAFRSGFDEVLSDIGYTIIKWRKMDEKGEFFLQKRQAEIDIIIKNKEKIALEVKSSLNFGEVDDFEKSVRFYQREENVELTKKIIVAIYPRRGVEEYAEQFNIKIIKGITEANKKIIYICGQRCKFLNLLKLK